MPDNSPFWLCYACGAQMRPLMDGDTPRCASCNSDFLEILDEEVNPDPLHELPHPPRRPGEATAPPPPPFGRPGEREWFQYGGGGAQDYNNPLPRPGERPVDTQPSFFGLLGELLGVGAARPGGAQTPDPRRPDDQQYEYRAYDNPPTQRDHANAPDTDPSSLRDHDQDHEHPSGTQRGPRSRQWRFNIGGGMATIHFGSLGGSTARDPWVGGYDGAPGDPSQGLDAYFRGFGAGVAQPRRPPEGMDLLQALMALVAEEGGATAFLPAHANVGDYVMTEDGFNDVLERLMQAAGPQGPIPAPDDVIRNLPHFTFTEVSLKESAFEDCAVCKEDFLVGDRAIKLPCEHVYHEDCLVPWLERNGSCPVCRKSLIPENPRPQASRQNSRQAQTGTGPSGEGADGTREHEAGGQQQPATGGGMFANVAQTVVTGVLNRLFGQQGAPTSTDSQPTPSRDEHVPGAFTETRRDDGPPDWYRNFFAPSPDAPQTPAEPPDTDTAAPPPAPAAAQSGPSGLNIDTDNLHASASTESLRVPSPSRRLFGSQEVRRTPSNGFRQGPRTPTSASRPSTPGTYLYNPGEVGQRPSPLFATPFFQLPGQTPPNGAPVNTSPQDALAEALSESIAPEPNAGDAVPTAREYLAAPAPALAPVPAPALDAHTSNHPAPDNNTAQTAPVPTAPTTAEPAAAEATGLSNAPWSNLESTEWKDAAPPHRPPSPPPQLEQAAQAEQAEWGKQRPEDDPPEPLAEELNEYRQRQAERERRAKEEGTFVDDLD